MQESAHLLVAEAITSNFKIWVKTPFEYELPNSSLNVGVCSIPELLYHSQPLSFSLGLGTCVTTGL